jgi:hypothetical protein
MSHTNISPNNAAMNKPARTFQDLIGGIHFGNEEEKVRASLAIPEYLRVNGWTPLAEVPVDFTMRFANSIRRFVRMAGKADFGGLQGISCQFLVRRLLTANMRATGEIHDQPGTFSEAIRWVVARYAIRVDEMCWAMQDWVYSGSLPSPESVPIVVRLERALDLQDELTVLLPRRYVAAPEENPEKPAAMFGVRLRQLRVAGGVSRPKLLKMISRKVTHALLYKINTWENHFLRPLNPRDAGLVAEIDQALNAGGELSRMFDNALSANPYLQSEIEVNRPYAHWSEKLEEEFLQLREFKTALTLPKRIRRGTFAVWRSRESEEIARRAFAAYLGFCRLSSNPDARLCGQGVPEEQLTLFLVADADLFMAYLEFRRSRSLSGEFYRGLIALVAMMRTLVRKGDGYFWQYAARFAHLDHLLARAPRFKTLPGGEQGPGLESPVERLREMCEEAEERYTQFIDVLADTVEFSRDPICRARLIFEKFPQPVDALKLLHRRMVEEIPREVGSMQWAIHVSNITMLLLLSVEPLRVRTLTELCLRHFRRLDGVWSANVPRELFKNPRGGARKGWQGPLAHVLNFWFNLYVDQARPIILQNGDCPFLFVNARGQLSPETLRFRVMSQTKRYLADYAPTGLNPHVFRHIVASD